MEGGKRRNRVGVGQGEGKDGRPRRRRQESRGKVKEVKWETKGTGGLETVSPFPRVSTAVSGQGKKWRHCQHID